MQMTTPCSRSLVVLLSASIFLTHCGKNPTAAPDSAAAPQTPSGIAVPALQQLSREADFTRPLRGGESHQFAVSLPTGHTLGLEVEQKGIDLLVEFEGPLGTVLRRVDFPHGRAGIEPLAFTAEEANVFHLRIRATEDEPAGTYRLRVLKLGAADHDDLARSEALAQYLSGDSLRFDPATHSQALVAYRRALELWQKLGDEPLLAARAVRRIARVLYEQGKIPESIERFEHALSQFRKLTNGWELTPLLNEAGYAFWQAGEPQEALYFFEEALEISKTLDHALGAAAALNNTGILYDSLGRHEDALVAYDQAVDLLHTVGPTAYLTRILHNIGVAYLSLGRFPEARKQLQRALEMNRRFGNKKGQAVNLSALGRVSSSEGDEQGALRSFEEALALRRTTEDVLGEASTLDHQGTSYLRMNRSVEALNAYQAALDLIRKAGNRLNEAHTLAHLGMVHLASGNLTEARTKNQLALELFRQIGDLQGEAAAQVALAEVDRKNGNLHAARKRLEDALRLVETVRAQLQGFAFRRSYLAAQFDHYDAYISLLMELDAVEPDQGYGIRAFETAEKVRARGLWEHLASDGDWSTRAAPALRQRGRALRERIQARETQRRNLASTGGRRESIELLEQEIQTLLAEYQKLDGALRRSAGIDAIASNQAADLGTIQNSLLDQETTLLSYHLGEEQSFLWVVNQETFSSHRLPSKAQFEVAIRQTLRDWKRSDLRLDRREFQEKTHFLRRLVFGPAFSSITTKRLVILADGMLATLPFAALPLPSLEGEYAPLIERFEVVSSASASVLALIRNRARESPPKTLAVFADPVFRAKDLEGSNTTHNTPSATSPNTPPLAAHRSALDRLLPLPFARREAEAILNLVENPELRFSALGFEATRSAVLNTNLAAYRFVHFATHGFLNSQHPSLSGIVLSLVDPEGRSLDGFLRVHEIERLDLTAELVVLSACGTALGETVRGEGIVGMSQAFFRAGARAMVASHWNVDDQATAILMKRFYAGMLGEKALAPSAALRAAQNSLRAEPSRGAPYFWAAFTLQGDWQ